jgi:hypothetical protein
MTQKEVSDRTTIPEATLKNWRVPGRAPKDKPPIPWKQLPNGSWVCREDDLEQWIDMLPTFETSEPDGRASNRKLG